MKDLKTGPVAHSGGGLPQPFLKMSIVTNVPWFNADKFTRRGILFRASEDFYYPFAIADVCEPYCNSL